MVEILTHSHSAVNICSLPQSVQQPHAFGVSACWCFQGQPYPHCITTRTRTTVSPICTYILKYVLITLAVGNFDRHAEWCTSFTHSFSNTLPWRDYWQQLTRLSCYYREHRSPESCSGTGAQCGRSCCASCYSCRRRRWSGCLGSPRSRCRTSSGYSTR